MDRISKLSDDLLLKILSELPTKDVGATIVLSKRWKSLWKMVPKLDFYDRHDYYYNKDYYDDENGYYRKFRQYVDRFLVLHESPILETLRLELGWLSSIDDLTTWIRIAIVRCLRELELHRFSEGEDFILPECLYTYEKLVVLKLYKYVVLDVPTTVCLSSLKALHLMDVEYKDNESHRRLLSGCPVLEELVLSNSAIQAVPYFYVVIPSLERLSIVDMSDDKDRFIDDYIVKLVIDAPSLKYLHIVDTCTHGLLCLSENMPEVIEAKVNVVWKSPEKLMRSLTSVKRLSLCLSASVLQHRIEFYQLVHLELCGDVPKWWNLLIWMLENSPKLQVLKLNKCWECCPSEEHTESRWGVRSSSIPECLLLHLNTFEWKYYNGRREEKKLVGYILKNARHLKTAAFSTWGLDQGKRSKKLKELPRLPRASSSCQFLLG